MKMFSFFLLYLLLMCFKASQAATVTVYNDSPFLLTATIIAADGSIKSSMSVVPQNSSVWNDSSPPNAVYSQTPYTVIFKCKDGSEFGVASGVGQGAWISAMQSSGKRYCQPKKQNQQSQDTQKNMQQEQEDIQQFIPNQSPSP